MDADAPQPDNHPGVSYPQALAILKDLGVKCSLRTLQRWVAGGILNVKHITCRTVILFRDEIEALAKKGKRPH